MIKDSKAGVYSKEFFEILRNFFHKGTSRQLLLLFYWNQINEICVEQQNKFMELNRNNRIGDEAPLAITLFLFYFDTIGSEKEQDNIVSSPTFLKNTALEVMRKTWRWVLRRGEGNWHYISFGLIPTKRFEIFLNKRGGNRCNRIRVRLCALFWNRGLRYLLHTRIMCWGKLHVAAVC